MSSNPMIVLKQERARSMLRHHPWVFSGAIDRVEGALEPGETVEIVAADGEWLARGAFSPASQIRARIWTFDRRTPIDHAFFSARLERAIAARRRLGLLGDTDACRLVFAEADGLPGLIVDRYASHLVCQFLSAGPERWRDVIVECLAELVKPTGIFERSESGARHKEGLPSRRGVLYGTAPPPTLNIVQDGIHWLVDLAQGQKTGAYLDQRANRRRVARYCADADVLDAFAYTGAFSLMCLANGARSATLVDSSSLALALAQQAATQNAVDDRCTYIEGDVFTTLRELQAAGKRFDLVVLDPPKFVHTAAQLKSGARGYKDVNRVALELIRAGGTLATFSCSGHVDAVLFRKIVAGAALDAGRDVQIVEQLAQGFDHPVALSFPEGEYLKGLILSVS